MKRIAVAVDRSAASLRAVDLASELAKRYGAEVVVLTVIRDVSAPDEALEQYARSEHISEPPARLAIETMRESLSDICDRARERGADKVAAEVFVGEPAAEILAFAASAQPDLIVIGSRGHGRLAGLLLGSVAQKVTDLARCAALVVH
jgi:nucleotide-binding universal stress UspA family protein